MADMKEEITQLLIETGGMTKQEMVDHFYDENGRWDRNIIKMRVENAISRLSKWNVIYHDKRVGNNSVRWMVSDWVLKKNKEMM